MIDHFRGIPWGVSFAALALLGGCAVVDPSPVVAPPSSEAQTISLGVEGAWSVNVDSADELVTDETGAYYCLLRRADDLAELRSQFFDRDQG